MSAAPASAPNPQLRRSIVLGVVGLLIAGLGLLLSQPLTPEGRFARMMIPHHAQAVELANILERRAADENLRYFAQDVAQTQAAQIGQMRRWLPLWRQPLVNLERPTPEQMQGMGMASQEDIAKLLSLQGREAETWFLQLMIRHHQGALPMIEEALPEVTQDLPKRLLTAMKNSQGGEIRTMENWLTDRGGRPLPFEPGQMEGMGH
ncbi:MAG: DUF305 domain-containing protein [Meiothermus sp.]|nr:DUF305 domain-containing protein [Meiothermus sp.]